MNVPDSKEIWQIDIGTEVYEANFEVLTQWVSEGSVLPQDKVRRGNLRWIEARKVPSLVEFFNAREAGLPPPVFTTSAGAESTPSVSAFPPPNSAPAPSASTSFGSSVPDARPAGQTFANAVAAPTAEVPAPESCALHPEAQVFYVCETCANGFCKVCPKSYGGTVKICPFCGSMCRQADKPGGPVSSALPMQPFVTGSFGIGDFFTALGYPFRYKSSLIFGAVMFMIFTLGQSASAMGGIFLVAASLICFMLANMLTFGVLTNVLQNFAQGITSANFMPSFEDFSLWDDVVHPFFLSIGVYLVSFGVLIAVVVGTAVYTVRTIADEMKAAQPQFELFDRVNPPPSFAANSSVPGDGASGNFNGAAYDEEEEFRKLNDFINNQRKQQLESAIGKTPETIEKEREAMLSGMLKTAVPLLLLGFASLLWGIFYFPAACLVAGYTKSFVSTLNPKVGLETIKLLGFDYVKVWFMGLAVLIMSGIVGFFAGLIFLPFNLPGVGNLPANAVSALFGFYASVVFSVVLGFALLKNSDRLRLFRS